MVVPGSTTRTTGPLNTVVVVTPAGNVVDVVDAVDGTGSVDDVDVGITVLTGPVAVCGRRPDTRVAMQSTPGKYKRYGFLTGGVGASQSTTGTPSCAASINAFQIRTG
jgi:hypothetical protein